MATFWKILTRKKVIDPATAEETSLSRVLNTFDLTALGVGSTLGVGLYVLAGHVAKTTAGPAVILSFLIAAIASVFAGLCYAEFGARAPRAGSAYIYSYVCVGEFIAFVIGWNLILEYVIGSASVAKGLSSYIDTLVNDTMQNAFIEVAPIDIPYLSNYFDFFAFGVSILLATALAFGLKESSLVNNIFTILNILVVLFIIIAGSFKADPANWVIQPAEHNSTNSTIIGSGGFFPFGVEGMIKGAATCFYGFVGFDCIATTGEEVKNPKKAIPISIILSLLIIFLAYFGTSTVITLMVPYYLQDPDAAISYAFEYVGWYTAKWIVSIGVIFGLCASLFGAMFPLPRIIYAMANDSLIFKFLGTVSSRFQTPVVGTLLAGLLTGLMAAIFELSQLVKMMSIGTLLAYTIVAASILLLRYARKEARHYMPVQTTSDSDDSETYNDNKIVLNSNLDPSSSEEQDLLNDQQNTSIIGQIFNCGRHKNPTKISSMIVTVEVAIYCLMCLFIGLSAIYLTEPITNGEIWAIVLTSIVVLIAVILIISLATQPTDNRELSFKVPMVPLVPALSILVNIYLMLMLDSHTWIRFAIWMVVGLPIYYFSVRPYKEAQNKSVSSKPSFDHTISMVNATQNGKLNGHNNIAFVDDGTIRKTSEEFEKNDFEKGPAPQPPKKDSDNTEIPPEITKLDEILEEVSNSINANLIDRKLSIGTLSNVSDVVSREENVIAVVHRDNVITPANSNAPPSPTDQKKYFNDNQSNLNNLDNNAPHINRVNETLSENILENNTQKEAPIKMSRRQNSVDSPLPPESSSSNSITEDSIASENNKGEETPEETKQLGYAAIPIAPPMQPSNMPTPPPSPNSSPPSGETVNNVPLPLPPPLPEPSEDIILPPRPTSANLNSVRLRPLKQREVIENESEKRYEPDDGNLKVGSDKYKSFLESLNGTLQKLSVLPTYIPYIRKSIGSSPETVNNNTARKKNENVIEESINQKEVIEKLNKIEGFLSRNLNNDIHKQADIPNTNEEENMDEQSETGVKTEEDGKKEGINNNIDNDYINHKNRMQNVFRSINLKNSDSFKSPGEENQRNAKSLGASFMIDDKIKHRQAMSEIFKSIELRRKDSKKQDNV